MTDLQFSEALDSSITGGVVAQGSPGYEDARRAWNLAADQRPAVVVLAESAADVGDAVRFARSHGMRVAPQSTGHGAMALEPLDGQLLLKLSRMRRVDVDPTRRKLRVEAGAQWQDVTVPADEHGLAALAGSSPNVGVIGYTLGGGLGWLARRYGLAANSVTAVELVTADGRLARIDADHEPELFWAVRGGGTVGVVTAMEMDLYPVREVYAGALFFPIARSAEVLQTWRAWTDTVPDEMTSIARILRLPPLPDIPEHLRGQDFALVEAAYLGDARTQPSRTLRTTSQGHPRHVRQPRRRDRHRRHPRPRCTRLRHPEQPHRPAGTRRDNPPGTAIRPRARPGPTGARSRFTDLRNWVQSGASGQRSPHCARVQGDHQWPPQMR